MSSSSKSSSPNANQDKTINAHGAAGIAHAAGRFEAAVLLAKLAQRNYKGGSQPLRREAYLETVSVTATMGLRWLLTSFSLCVWLLLNLMKLEKRIIAAAPLLVISFLFGSCNSSKSSNHPASNAAPDKNNITPTGARPLGMAGYFSIGPTGAVALRCTSPSNDAVIEGNSVKPTFEITGYPIYRDEERRKGQHLRVIIDNELSEPDYDPSAPFSPARFQNLKPGTHLLRAFPAREWNESIKQPDGGAFDLVVFYVKSKTPGIAIDKKAPLLTLSEPRTEVRWKEDPRGVLIDFYVINATLSQNEYKVKYTINNKKTELLNRWEPVWLKWEQLAPGDCKLAFELLDKDNKPVPFNVGGKDYNKIERTFRILAEREKSRADEKAP